ncbi:MAG: apolipoprotein N-acyltransferase [Clostridia bacterium]|nr:apolipoprotein N-acyltransferase [Clostridia bacterium]
MKNQRLFVLLLPLSGILTGLCLVFVQVGFLQWLSMVPALLFLFGKRERTETTYRRYYLYGLFYFLAYYLTVYHWFFALYPMEFAGIGKGTALALVLFCWLGLSLLQSLFSAFLMPLFIFLCRSKPVERCPLLTPLVFAALYTIFEWGQTLTWAGVPWGRLVLGQACSGILWNSAALFGPYLVTLVLVAVNALAAYAILHRQSWRVLTVIAASLFLFNGVSGAIGLFTADTDTKDGIVVAAVQGNIGSANKWNDIDGESKYDIYRNLTAEAVAQGAELIVFPETFIPMNISADSKLGMFVCELSKTHGVTILCGAFHTTPEGDEQNAVFAALPDGTLSECVYAKRHLVPFGEYVPMRGLIEAIAPWVTELNILSSDLAPGEGAALLETAYGQIGSLICFDSIYEELTLESVRAGAEILCLPTNDSWFRDSVATKMHLAQARLRAMESNRYIIRAADTGVSAIIAPDGTTEAELPAEVRGISVARVSPNSARTLYSYIGNLLVYLLIAAVSVLTVHRIYLFIKEKAQRQE